MATELKVGQNVIVGNYYIIKGKDIVRKGVIVSIKRKYFQVKVGTSYIIEFEVAEPHTHRAGNYAPTYKFYPSKDVYDSINKHKYLFGEISSIFEHKNQKKYKFGKS